MDPAEDDDFREALDDLENRLESSVKSLAEGEIRSLIQVAILRELVSGRRTLTELVEGIYRVSRGNEGFKTHYTRVRREIAYLESRGLVSRRMLGRERPYRLTQLAVARITRIAGVQPSWDWRILRRLDLVAFAAALGLVVVAYMGSVGLIPVVQNQLGLLRPTSLLLGGVALCRFLEMLRRVI